MHIFFLLRVDGPYDLAYFRYNSSDISDDNIENVDVADSKVFKTNVNLNIFLRENKLSGILKNVLHPFRMFSYPWEIQKQL